MTTDALVRTATSGEAASISDLALRSKGHWGYSDEFLDAVRAELTYTAADCASGDLFVAERDGALLGFYQLDGSPPYGELASLFVDLPFIGDGVGALLLQHALTEARDRGFVSVTLDSDPGAEPFYLRHGAVRIGEATSGSIRGRTLPRLRFDLPR